MDDARKNFTIGKGLGAIWRCQWLTGTEKVAVCGIIDLKGPGRKKAIKDKEVKKKFHLSLATIASARKKMIAHGVWTIKSDKERRPGTWYRLTTPEKAVAALRLPDEAAQKRRQKPRRPKKVARVAQDTFTGKFKPLMPTRVFSIPSLATLKPETPQDHANPCAEKQCTGELKISAPLLTAVSDCISPRGEDPQPTGTEPTQTKEESRCSGRTRTDTQAHDSPPPPPKPVVDERPEKQLTPPTHNQFVGKARKLHAEHQRPGRFDGARWGKTRKQMLKAAMLIDLGKGRRMRENEASIILALPRFYLKNQPGGWNPEYFRKDFESGAPYLFPAPISAEAEALEFLARLRDQADNPHGELPVESEAVA